VQKVNLHFIRDKLLDRLDKHHFFSQTQSEAISMIHSVKMMSKEIQHQGIFQLI